MSVLIEKIVHETGRTAMDVLTKHPALVAFTAGKIREMKHGVYRDPQPDESAHANVFDYDQPSRKNMKKSIQNKLVELSKWVIPPPESRE
ncbi:hypothetical protein KKB99_05525 [bacterium]|nr:hypothetical protein [bacterium]MBU1025456.1 hypothetical protein [bacterium]